MALEIGNIVIPLHLLSPLVLSSLEDLTEEVWYLWLSLTIAVHNLRVSANKDRAKLEIEPKIKTLKLCLNKAYHTPD